MFTLPFPSTTNYIKTSPGATRAFCDVSFLHLFWSLRGLSYLPSEQRSADQIPHRPHNTKRQSPLLPDSTYTLTSHPSSIPISLFLLFQYNHRPHLPLNSPSVRLTPYRSKAITTTTLPYLTTNPPLLFSVCWFVFLVMYICIVSMRKVRDRNHFKLLFDSESIVSDE